VSHGKHTKIRLPEHDPTLPLIMVEFTVVAQGPFSVSFMLQSAKVCALKSAKCKICHRLSSFEETVA
jgi:hypothetical protein